MNIGIFFWGGELHCCCCSSIIYYTLYARNWWHFYCTLTQNSPVVTPGNEPYVHHVGVTGCASLKPGVADGFSQRCSPSTGGTNACQDQVILGGWAIGGTVMS